MQKKSEENKQQILHLFTNNAFFSVMFIRVFCSDIKEIEREREREKAKKSKVSINRMLSTYRILKFPCRQQKIVIYAVSTILYVLNRSEIHIV